MKSIVIKNKFDIRLKYFIDDENGDLCCFSEKDKRCKKILDKKSIPCFENYFHFISWLINNCGIIKTNDNIIYCDKW